MQQMQNRQKYYANLCNLCLIAIKKGFKLIIENPYGRVNFLKQFFPIKPGLIIKDRRTMGDFYKKPTQFFFVNCEPEFKLHGECFSTMESKRAIERTHGFERSIISPAFAENFIKTYIID